MDHLLLEAQSGSTPVNALTFLLEVRLKATF